MKRHSVLTEADKTKGELRNEEAKTLFKAKPKTKSFKRQLSGPFSRRTEGTAAKP